jgi:hypothetical protein
MKDYLKILGFVSVLLVLASCGLWQKVRNNAGLESELVKAYSQDKLKKLFDVQEVNLTIDFEYSKTLSKAKYKQLLGISNIKELPDSVRVTYTSPFKNVVYERTILDKENYFLIIKQKIGYNGESKSRGL